MGVTSSLQARKEGKLLGGGGNIAARRGAKNGAGDRGTSGAAPVPR